MGDKVKAKEIYDLKRDIARYGFYNSSLDIGIKYGPQDLTFSEMFIYSAIKGGLSGRKTTV